MTTDQISNIQNISDNIRASIASITLELTVKQNELTALNAEIAVLNNLLASLDGSATNIADAVSNAKTTLNID
jgi:predicted  nucleic acid-binding Zn-ribbon protein